MKISLFILLGLTMAFMVQIGEGKQANNPFRGTCTDYFGRKLKGNESFYRVWYGKEERCDCPWSGGELNCYPYKWKKGTGQI
jgi:hypothetical protein